MTDQTEKALDLNDTLSRMEAVAPGGDALALVSIAISLKRIADTLGEMHNHRMNDGRWEIQSAANSIASAITHKVMFR